MPQYDLAGNPLAGSDAPPQDGHGNPPSAGAPQRPTVPMRYDLAGNPLPGSPAPVPAAVPPRYDLAGNPLPAASTPEARYDLAGNPLPAAPPPAGPAWPPAPQPYGGPPAGGYGRPAMRNTSGELGDVPPEVARLRWNWGAFFFPIRWCRRHGMTSVAGILVAMLVVPRFLNNMHIAGAAVLASIALVCYWGVKLYFGFTGHRHGWRYRRFESFEEFIQEQRRMMWWGFGLFALEVVGLAVLYGAIFSAHTPRDPYDSAAPGVYGHPGGFGAPGADSADDSSPSGGR